MTEDVRMAEIAALVGDPARANILSALMGGYALTAKELAGAAGVSPQTTSGHLGKLAGANLIAGVHVEKGVGDRHLQQVVLAADDLVHICLFAMDRNADPKLGDPTP